MPTSHPSAVPVLLAPPGSSVKSIQPLADGSLAALPLNDGSPCPQLFHNAITVRSLVFIVEQQCKPELEIDDEDQISWHWIIHASPASGKAEVPAATIRLIPVQGHPDADDQKAVEGPDYHESNTWDQKEPYVKIGRLATLKEFRGRGYARVLVEAAVQYAGKHPDEMAQHVEAAEWRGLVMVHAQIQLEKWYASLGFKTDEGLGRFWEDGIEHVGMWRREDVEPQQKVLSCS